MLTLVAQRMHQAVPGGSSMSICAPSRQVPGLTASSAKRSARHWVRLEDSPSGPRVADCRVLAPTEWNFHPRGVLAQTLATLHGADCAGQAARAAVAFDPCVEFDIDSGIDCTPAMEPAHA